MGKVQNTCSECRHSAYTDPDGIIQPLRPHVDAILSAAIAKNTADTYQRGLESFGTFRNKFSLQLLWPPPVHQLVNYIAYLASNSISYSTARCYISGISYQLQLQGHTDHTKTFIVKKMLEGMHRLNPSKDIRAPITLPLLGQLVTALSSVCANSYETTLFATAFELAFFALLRVSEFTVSSRNAVVLLETDIHLIDSQIMVHIKGSKTDQLGKGATIQIPLNTQTTTLFTHLNQYLSIRPNVSGPFFCHLNAKPLTSYQFTSILHKTIKFIGLDTTSFKSHSFRIGSATHMFLQGIPEEEIKIKGRWKSNAVYSYIRI